MFSLKGRMDMQFHLGQDLCWTICGSVEKMIRIP